MRFEDFNFRQRFAKKHPLLSQFSSSLPSNIKELFEWMEFIISNNPIASAGIKKLSETPVTNFKYYVQDDSEEVTLSNENSWKSILETQIDLKSHLLKISYNVLLYGNAFVSVSLLRKISAKISCTETDFQPLACSACSACMMPAARAKPPIRLIDAIEKKASAKTPTEPKAIIMPGSPGVSSKTSGLALPPMSWWRYFPSLIRSSSPSTHITGSS